MSGTSAASSLRGPWCESEPTRAERAPEEMKNSPREGAKRRGGTWKRGTHVHRPLNSWPQSREDPDPWFQRQTKMPQMALIIHSESPSSPEPELTRLKKDLFHAFHIAAGGPRLTVNSLTEHRVWFNLQVLPTLSMIISDSIMSRPMRNTSIMLTRTITTRWPSSTGLHSYLTTYLAL